MNCTEAQAKIEDFLQGKLPNDQKAGFIKHVNSCKACRDELEVYHVVYSVLSQLDDDKPSTGNIDYEAELDKKLRLSEERIKKSRVFKSATELVIFAIMMILICLLIM